MRTQTFAAFLLTAALPAIVAALPTNIPSQLTSAPVFEARSTHEIEDLQLGKRPEIAARGEDVQEAYIPEETWADGSGDDEDEGSYEQATYQYEGQEPEEPEDGFVGDDEDVDEFLRNLGDVDMSQFDEDENTALTRRGENDSNFEGELDGERQGVLVTRSEPVEVDNFGSSIPSQFRRRHDDGPDHHEVPTNIDNGHIGHGEEGHEDHKRQVETPDEEWAEAVQRRDLDDIAGNDDGEDDAEDYNDALAGINMASHDGEDDEDDDDVQAGVNMASHDEEDDEDDNDDRSGINLASQDEDEEDDGPENGFYNPVDTEFDEGDVDGLQKRDDEEEEAVFAAYPKRSEPQGGEQQGSYLAPKAMERRVARSFRA